MPRCKHPADDRDAETARLLSSKDGAGLRRLLRAYGRSVQARLRQAFGTDLGEDDIEGAMNTATYRVWRRADDYDPAKGTLRAWFFVIASNACRELVRAKRRRAWETPAAGIEHVAEPTVVIPSEPPPAYLDVLRECIDLLPALQRSIIEADLRTGGVASASELAEALRTTASTIYVARNRARKALRRALEAHGHAPEPAGPQPGTKRTKRGARP
jgi:RNA polymerase sigma-70 factor (ECF subfamily)